jgi:hypothetical protein
MHMDARAIRAAAVDLAIIEKVAETVQGSSALRALSYMSSESATPIFVVRGRAVPSYGQILPAASEVGTAGVVSCTPA